jgi:hypothetical protein
MSNKSVWCVQPEDFPINLTYVDATGKAHPFWIKDKKLLNVGEDRRVATAGWGGVRPGARGTDDDPGTEVKINWQTQSFARTEIYLTDWSLETDEKKKLPLTRETIESLHPPVFALIEEAINEHVKALAEEKKRSSGESAPSTTSE